MINREKEIYLYLNAISYLDFRPHQILASKMIKKAFLNYQCIFSTVRSFLELCKGTLCNNSNGWLFVIHTFKTTAITVIHLNIAPALHFCHLKCLWSFSFQLRQQKLLRLFYLYVKYYAHFDCKHWTLNEKNIPFICSLHANLYL